MILKLSKIITQKLLSDKIVILEDSDSYEYGLYMLFYKILYLLIFMAIGLAFGMLIETIILILVYSSLRKVTGGFHANTEKKCLFVTILTILCMIFLTKLFYSILNLPLIIALLLFSIGIIIMLSPVENANKILDKLEVIHYRKYTYYIIIFWVLCIIFMKTINIVYYIPVFIGVFIESITLIIGKFTIILTHNNNE